VKDEITVISHSNVFYWWPVWVLGFIFGIWTMIEGHVMVTVPQGNEDKNPLQVATSASCKATIQGNKDQTFEDREIIILPRDGKLPRPKDDVEGPPSKPKVHMSRSKGLGVIFCVTLLAIILVTNLPLRGVVAILTVIGVVMLVIILVLAGVWGTIAAKITPLDIRINAGGYFFIAGVLLAIWLMALLVVDRTTYIVFTPTEFRVCTLGGKEQVLPTLGMVWQEDRGAVRHWIPGLRLVGDLVVRTTGASAHHFDLPNVLFIGHKVKTLEAIRDRSKQH